MLWKGRPVSIARALYEYERWKRRKRDREAGYPGWVQQEWHPGLSERWAYPVAPGEITMLIVRGLRQWHWYAWPGGDFERYTWGHERTRSAAIAAAERIAMNAWVVIDKAGKLVGIFTSGETVGQARADVQIHPTRYQGVAPVEEWNKPLNIELDAVQAVFDGVTTAVRVPRG